MKVYNSLKMNRLLHRNDVGDRWKNYLPMNASKSRNMRGYGQTIFSGVLMIIRNLIGYMKKVANYKHLNLSGDPEKR